MKVGEEQIESIEDLGFTVEKDGFYRQEPILYGGKIFLLQNICNKQNNAYLSNQKKILCFGGDYFTSFN